MNINFVRKIQIKQFAVLALLAVCFTQLPVRGVHGSHEVLVESWAWGMVPGQKTRITVVNKNLRDGSRLGTDPLTWRVAALDADGNQVFQSPEVVTPAGGFRYIDIEPADIPVPSDTLTGRKQVLWKIILLVHDVTQNPVPVSAELIDSAGKTTLGHTIGFRHEHIRPE